MLLYLTREKCKLGQKSVSNYRTSLNDATLNMNMVSQPSTNYVIPPCSFLEDAHEGDQISEIYLPTLRKYDISHSNEDVEHLDIVTVWKGITATQARELVMWRTVFREVLEDKLQKYHERGNYVHSPHREKCEYQIPWYCVFSVTKY